MLPLLRVQLLHVYRNRLIILGIVAGLLFELAGLTVARNVTLSFQNVVSQIGWQQSLFGAILLQLLTAVFVAAAAGIFLVPYPHQGLRAVLTYSMPLHPLSVVGAQSLFVLLLMSVQFLLGFSVYAFHVGMEPLRGADFPWLGLFGCLGLLCLAGATLAFWLAAITLRLGALAAFFISGFSLFVLQVCSFVLRIGGSSYFEQFAETVAKWRTYYRFLPPFGDLVFDIRDTIFKAETATNSIAWIGWAAWLVLGVLAFTWSQKAQLNRRSVA